MDVSIDAIKEYEKNARINDKAVDKVKESIKEFGFQSPIILDKNNTIIAGHTRLKAAKELGYKKVPCIIAKNLTPEQVKAYRLADNKTSELAEWDFDFLQLELQELLADGFDIDSIGFSSAELDAIVSGAIDDSRQYIQEQAKEISKRYGETYTPPTQVNEQAEVDYKDRAKQFESPTEFKSYDENIETKHCCPKCGFRW